MAKKRELKVIFITPVPLEGAGCRFRILQYLPFLKEHGVRAIVRPFFFSRFFAVVYKKGHFPQKAFYFFIATLGRLCDLVRACFCDMIFIYREAYPIGPAGFESLIHLLGKPIVYDFDDAIFISNSSKANKFVNFFRINNNAEKIIKISDFIIVGNNYLKDFALQFNDKVAVIPTVVDTNSYTPRLKKQNNRVTIGWMGTFTTQQYLLPLARVIKRLNDKYKDKIQFKFIASGENLRLEGVTWKEWSLEQEKQELGSFDIGLMPLPDNAWARGKCGFKAILYMSIGIPCVCSPVGSNKEIINDGVNGFLADSEEEWIEKISLLIDSEEVREKIGARARDTVERLFSLEGNAPKFLDVIRKAYEQRFSKRSIK
ncbi:MAG: glycosyltransferase family 1 protein [Candidatus Omnitrophota bacterium]|nr:MAG: glycosyltransferase family 1 protein [Candidatus Omnitrophota bacterium]